MGLKPTYRLHAAFEMRPRMDAEQVLGSPTTPLNGAYPQPYRAASQGRRLVGWRPANSGPNSVVSLAAPELLRRSRDLRRNNPHAKRAVDLLAGHVVGTGIKPRSTCTNKKVRQALTKLFGAWSRVADADGQLDFYGLQALAVSEMIEGGETFARLRTRRLTDGLPVPFQVQLLPAEQLPLQWQTLIGTNRVRQGIERDPIGRRVAYWFYPENPTDLLAINAGVDMTPAPVPAADVVHLYVLNRIGQLRGLPWLASAMTTLFQIGEYNDAELLRKQIAAAMVAFVKQPTSEDPTVEQIAALGARVDDGQGPPAVVMEPGTVQYLEPGEDMVFNTPADVGANYAAFLAANYQAVAVAANVLYEELTGDWSKANDRTFRAAFNTFKRLIEQLQFNTVVTQFCTPVWDRFVDYAVASGALNVPKSLTLEDLHAVDWVGDRWEYLQPVQDVEAVGLQIGLGLISRSRAVAARGDDVEEIDAQIVADNQREAELGLAFGAGLAKASLTPDLSAVDQTGAVTPSSNAAKTDAPPADGATP